MASAPRKDDLRDSIYNAAEACDALFDQLLVALSEAGPEHYNTGRQIYSSFERWAGFLGVFAPESVSLDRRLKSQSSPHIRNTFLQLLAVVERNARDIIRFESTTRQTGESKSGSGPSSGGGISPGAQAALRGMQDALENLHRAGAATRMTSTSSLKLRVTKFMQSPEEKNLFDFYRRIDLLAVKGLYPGTPSSLAEQLAESVTFRRGRLKFQRMRQQKLETRRPPAALRTKEPTRQTEPGPSPAPAEPLRDSTKRSEAFTIAPSAHGPSVTATDLTSVDEQRFKQSLETEELPKETLDSSGPLTVSGIGYSNPYPRLPNSPQCNWCFRDHKVLRGQDGWKQAWKNHFKHDLQPYVCISERCSSDLEYFASLREWQHHMNNEHSLGWIEEIHRSATWFCEIDNHSYQDFQTEKDLRAHLQAAHPGKFTIEQQNRAVKRNVVYVSRASRICPLCKTEVESHQPPPVVETQDSTPPSAQPTALSPPLPPKKPTKRQRFIGIADPENSDEDDRHLSMRRGASGDDADELAAAEVQHWRANQIRLGTHIASHLKSLAFRSLRYLDDVTNEENEKRSERAASGAEEAMSSTQGQRDHYFELDELNLNPDRSFQEQDALERSVDEDIPDLAVQYQNTLATIQKARLREQNPGMPETDDTQTEVATSYSVSNPLDKSLYGNDNAEITTSFPSGSESQSRPPSSQPCRLGLEDDKVSICLDRGEAAEAEYLYNHPETVSEPTRCHDHEGDSIDSIIKCELDEACVAYPAEANARFFIPRRKLRSILSPERVLELIKHLTCCNHLSATQKKHLREKICSPKTACWKLLAVLVRIGKQEQLIELVEIDGVSDRCLPIQLTDAPSNVQKDCHINGQSHKHRIIDEWNKKTRRKASVWSYAVKAPYFSRRRGQHNHYIFDINDVLPVINTFSISSPNAPKSHHRSENEHGVFSSGFSNVEKVELDESHFHFEGLEAWNRGSGGRRVALKTLHSRGREAFSNELASLTSFQDQEEKHLIQVLATFEVVRERTSTYHLLFPWAQGDLWAFWMNHESRDQRIPRGLWMAQQIYHIAKALMAFHNVREQHLRQDQLNGVGDGNSRQIDLFGRHGDIKAENILWFEDTDSLVITDFGLSRINSKYSRSGVDPRSVDKTSTYRAPEFDLSLGRISRASDIFSLGCMCLEFVTWYLLGWEAVAEEFPLYRTEPDIHDIETDTFFAIEGLVMDKDGKVIDRTNEKALIKPRVRAWIRKLRASEDSSCYTLQLLELIEEEMLEPVSSKRINSSELVRKLKFLADACERTPSFYEEHCGELPSRSNTHRD